MQYVFEHGSIPSFENIIGLRADDVNLNEYGYGGTFIYSEEYLTSTSIDEYGALLEKEGFYLSGEDEDYISKTIYYRNDSTSANVAIAVDYVDSNVYIYISFSD